MACLDATHLLPCGVEALPAHLVRFDEPLVQRQALPAMWLLQHAAPRQAQQTALLWHALLLRLLRPGSAALCVLHAYKQTIISPLGRLYCHWRASQPSCGRCCCEAPINKSSGCVFLTSDKHARVWFIAITASTGLVHWRAGVGQTGAGRQTQVLQNQLTRAGRACASPLGWHAPSPAITQLPTCTTYGAAHA